MAKEIKIGLAEDHKGVRQGYVSMLKTDDGIKIVFDVSNGLEVLESIRKHRIDILLLDIRMPEMDGKSLLRRLHENHSDIKVIILSAFKEVIEVLDCVKLGAKAFLNKEAEIEEIIDAIYNVYDKGTHYNAHVTKILLDNIKSKPNSLTTTINDIRPL